MLLDEVQLLNDFVDVLNGLMHSGNVDLYVTGSNARLLSKDIVTEFRGRGQQIHVAPLSFAELMSVYHGTKEEALEMYMHYGGLPPVVLQPNDEYRTNLLKSLLKETYLIDIQQ